MCQRKCDRNCGSTTIRNLVVCLDGTSNQFGHHNTNVIELHSRILKEDQDIPQLTFYRSGIGTFVPPQRFSLRYWLSLGDNVIDQAIAWHVESNVKEAYQWLADNYQRGDRIYLFGSLIPAIEYIGFSRGAYQIRMLSGMIEKVSFWLLGVRLLMVATEARSSHSEIKDETEAEALAYNFKKTFSRPIKVHFVGAWDTVSSVGIVRKHSLPLAGAASCTCFFRHALALDERRVKFLPEYFSKGSTPRFGRQPECTESTDVKEVWFAGSHSDILNLSRVPLLWMVKEASAAGLRFTSRNMESEWEQGNLHKAIPIKSLKGSWWFLEYVHITRLSYKDENSTTR
ncbi:uncharacterized protein EV420DRAFT_1274070 [Desarmillaria tabescens]|uniref:T6SS Phospholipase effector Tle1-like catalytic domain-containing protein n=1 Tax=Armillaria tabescens TaxID=1929756 RepID=A0AA39MY92_ARMTA|nr:uncharacterized protein EV420DRAFT_1274070 [Desarmillaria tabescens]KAK0451381.1 hypothetical protein EV420DRAFT_1274070 [Desarmillaria tabescens]